MHNLIRFIKLNQFLLVFILVEGISIYILINNNSYQATNRQSGEKVRRASRTDIVFGSNSQLRALVEIYAQSDNHEKFVNDLKEKYFTATILYKEESINDVLSYLSQVYGLKYQIINNKILIE